MLRLEKLFEHIEIQLKEETDKFKKLKFVNMHLN